MPNITTVYNSGLDALSNLFEVSILLDGTLGDYFSAEIQNELKFRTQGFTIPASTVETYTIDWGAWQFERPSGKVNSTRTISFDVRVDRAYEVYQGFTNWKNAIQNEYTGVVSNVKDLTTTITVLPITTLVGESGDYVNGTVGAGVSFEHCWPSEVGDISYDQGSGDPLTLNLTFTFLRMNKDMHAPSGSSGDQGSDSTDDAQ